MTDLKTQVLECLSKHQGITEAQIGEELGFGQVLARGALLELKSKGHAYDVKSPGNRYWYRARGGGYNPPGDVA